MIDLPSGRPGTAAKAGKLHAHAPLGFCGIGVHSGKPCRMDLRLTSSGGIRFVVGRQSIPASLEHLESSHLCNRLSHQGARVQTVEHLLSALLALGFHHAEIHVEGGELPILDGSAKEFAHQLEPFQSVALPVTKPIDREIRVHDGERFAALIPDDAFNMDVRLNHPHPLLRNQRYVGSPFGPHYQEAIAWARTFGFVQSWPELKHQGLALGSSLDNTIGLTRQGLAEGCAFSHPDEAVRHKVLDALGDMALWPFLPRARYVACNAGHALNARLGRRLYPEKHKQQRHGTTSSY